MWEETQARRPRQAGPGAVARSEGCCLDPQDKEVICHTRPCDKGQHLAHGKGQGSFREPRIQAIWDKDQSLHCTWGQVQT